MFTMPTAFVPMAIRVQRYIPADEFQELRVTTENGDYTSASTQARSFHFVLLI